jgi:putative flippase GtrA
MIINFFGSRSYIFMHEGSLRGASVRYVAVAAIGYLINIGLFILLIDNLGYPHKWVQIAAILIVAGYLFLSFKYFVFKNVKTQKR